MKILVTGGTVFVSKYVAEYFSNRGHKVYVLNRNTRTQLPNVKLIECDRTNICGKLKHLHFDAVVDVTAYTAQDVNNLLDELDRFDNYVLISSSAVYPETTKLPFKESDKVGANYFWGTYGTNKIAAENAAIKRIPDAYIIRPPYLYGEYNNVYREAFVFDCAERSELFYIPNDGTMPLQFFHVEDLCRFIEIILDKKPKQKVFNVGNAPITVNEWVEACYNAVGKNFTVKYVTDGREQRCYFPFYNYGYVLDVSAQNELMPKLLPLNEGLSRAYNWYKKNRNCVNVKNYFNYINENLK
ncbi:MAG: NAD-dependent epimerase/dehydratase family protein [Clostridia bacterium]|nr:NAD-dependent epimerase/dehydratase family protein [Clostridia bacterium]